MVLRALKGFRGFSALCSRSVVRNSKQTSSASIKLSAHACMSFPGFDTNL